MRTHNFKQFIYHQIIDDGAYHWLWDGFARKYMPKMFWELRIHTRSLLQLLSGKIILKGMLFTSHLLALTFKTHQLALNM
jgi:hypothetical protein